jgi:hypothetical protein
MAFTLEALEARHGDALLVHYGTAAERHLVVVDGGPPGVYARRLQPRLEQLRQPLGPDEPLRIELVLVSHVDDDHIGGIVELAAELADMVEDRNVALPFEIGRLWLNSFDDIIGNQGAELFSRVEAAARRNEAVPGGQPVSPSSLAVAASVGQGRTLRDHANKLALEVNRPFRGMVAAGAATNSARVELAGGLSLTVMAPTLARLEALQQEWDKELRRLGVRPAELLARAAELLDTSITNLASIVVLAELGGRTILLTGDARADDIVDGLRGAGLLAGGAIHVDVLKLPHHGSQRSVDAAFFRTVTADHYVVSGNGRHGNPELATLEMLSDARGDDEFTIELTNREDRLVSFFEGQRAAGKRYTVSFRDADTSSLRVDLG